MRGLLELPSAEQLSAATRVNASGLGVEEAKETLVFIQALLPGGGGGGGAAGGAAATAESQPSAAATPPV